MKLPWSPLLLACAAILLSCRTMAPFPGPIDPPPQPSALVATSDAEAPPALPLPGDASPAPSDSAPAPVNLMSCEEQHTRFASLLSNRRKSTDLVRECFRKLADDTPKISGTVSAFMNPDGTLLTVRSMVTPSSAQFVGCVELRARQWLHLHPGCAGGKQRVSFAVDAKSVGR